MKTIKQLLGLEGKPEPKMLGSGAASNAASALKNRGYNLYKQTTLAEGGTPLSYEEWMRQQR